MHSEIILEGDTVKVSGLQTIITDGARNTEIRIDGTSITLDAKNLSPISLKNATAIDLTTKDSGSITLNDGHCFLGADYITLTSEGSSGITLNGNSGTLNLRDDVMSLTNKQNTAGITFDPNNVNIFRLDTGLAMPYISASYANSKRSLEIGLEEGIGKICIDQENSTLFQNNQFRFEPCANMTDPVYIKVPVVDSTTNKLDRTYARLYVSKSSTGTLELKVEADS